MSRPVWKNEEARLRLEAWYSEFQGQILHPVQSRTVATSFGSSHVLVGGPEGAPPLVCLHAMRTGSAHLLSEMGEVLTQFRVIAPDLPGQSVRGPQLRMPFKEDSHARWLFEVLDALDIGSFNLFGVSWGGYVARAAAIYKQERVKRLALLVPAGIVNGSHWKGLTRMAVPMIQYSLTGREKDLRNLLSPILTEWDPRWAAYMGESLRDMPMDPRIPPLASDQELKGLSMPVLVMGAEHDISFPGKPLVTRMKSLVQDCEGEIILDCKHCPPTTQEFRAWLSNRLSGFFAEGETG